MSTGSNADTGFMDVARQRHVVMNALRISLIVGTALALINHGDAVLRGSVETEQVVKLLLTYMVPYCVATYSAVKAIQSNKGSSSSQQFKS